MENAQLVLEAERYIVSGRVEGDRLQSHGPAVFALELPRQITPHADEVPHSQSPIFPANRHEQRPLNANRQICYFTTVESVVQVFKSHLF